MNLLSILLDGLVFVLVWLVGSHPWIGLVVASSLAILAVVIAWKLSRYFRRVFRRTA
jgi:membrane protein implicated in regulation of membrane protease activity